jgi:hypothetical protein
MRYIGLLDVKTGIIKAWYKILKQALAKLLPTENTV